jgi:hypothetical protein
VTIALRITVPAIAAGLLLAGCGGTSENTATPASTSTTTSAAATTSTAPSGAIATKAPAADPSPTKPAGSKVFADKANKYQLAIPAGYTRITSKAQLAKVAKASASVAAKAGVTQQLANKNLKLIAIRPAGTESLNVVVTAGGGLTSDQLPELEPELKKEVQTIGAKGVVIKKATLGGDPALRANYTLEAQGKHMATVQYITVHGDRVYTLTFSRLVKVLPKVEKQTLGSWRFL